MFGTGVVVGADVVDGVVLGTGVVVIAVSTGSVVEPLKKLVIVEIIDVSVGAGIVSVDVGVVTVGAGVVVGADVVDGVELGAGIVIIVVCSGLVSDGSVDVG